MIRLLFFLPRDFEEYCKRMMRIKNNKFLNLLSIILTFIAKSSLTILGLVIFLSIIFIAILSFAVILIPFTSLTFNTLATIIGELFLFDFYAIVLIIAIYIIISSIITNKTGYDSNEYVKKLKEWREACNQLLKEKENTIDAEIIKGQNNGNASNSN